MLVVIVAGRQQVTSRLNDSLIMWTHLVYSPGVSSLALSAVYSAVQCAGAGNNNVFIFVSPGPPVSAVSPGPSSHISVTRSPNWGQGPPELRVCDVSDGVSESITLSEAETSTI